MKPTMKCLNPRPGNPPTYPMFCSTRSYEVTVENIEEEFKPGEIPIHLLYAMPDDLSLEMLNLSDETRQRMAQKGIRTFGDFRKALGSPLRGY